MSDIRNFRLGAKVCLITMQPSAECPHCAARRLTGREGEDVVTVTSVDHSTRTVTFDRAPFKAKVP